MKIAMLGGTYDPIHYGHIMLGRQFAMQLHLDKVIVVPTRIPPHKAASATPGDIRLEMCRLAVEEAGGCFEVSDFELNREGPSYSFYTISELIRQYPDSDVYLIIGADMFMTLETWHRFDELKELVTFCTVPRDDTSIEELQEYSEKLDNLGCRTYVTNVVVMPVSSTLIRQKAARGISLRGLVPEPVEQFILDHGLYRMNEDQILAGVNIDG